jgi:hypothetical protein
MDSDGEKNEEERKRLDIKDNLMHVIIKIKLALFGHVCTWMMKEILRLFCLE